MPPRLVIFDCDGVLVDTETIANEILSRFAEDLGLDLSPEECQRRFQGLSLGAVKGELETLSACLLPINWIDQVRQADIKAFQKGIDPIANIEGQILRLKECSVPFCVASSGSYAKMHTTLGAAGLLKYFQEVLYSAQDVENGKPAPDVFLYAAREMGYTPDQCVVIEDSMAGIVGAKAAGMSVLAYMQNSFLDQEQVIGSGATPFSDMRELPRLLHLL
ncbi:HAD family hydrolase [Flexibacterium corallicola]|uniref:HAD family hydrolase n=1 Tax=Flexibacterium corallicola TaxID=3037259 RepID=UPI00286F8318|nr:HAD family phosphatase [Pseudovibrio sp. M1P-2-3]